MVIFFFCSFQITCMAAIGQWVCFGSKSSLSISVASCNQDKNGPSKEPVQLHQIPACLKHQQQSPVFHITSLLLCPDPGVVLASGSCGCISAVALDTGICLYHFEVQYCNDIFKSYNIACVPHLHAHNTANLFGAFSSCTLCT